MNEVIIAITLVCLVILSIVNWIAWMLVGFTFAFTKFYFIYELTPYIGLAGTVGLFILAHKVYNSDPMAFIKSKMERTIGK